jgi:uncharacterized membrane protein YccC
VKQAARRFRRRLTDAFVSRWRIGLHAALSVGIPLLAGAATHHTSDGALASIGSFAGFYGPETPYRHRVRLVAGVGLALTVLVPLGSLCAATAWLSVVLIGLVAASASFVCLALRVPPPREYLIVLGVLAATGIPAGLAGALREAGLVAGGAVLGGVITMAPALGRDRSRPQQQALAQSWDAVGDLLRTAGTPDAAAARTRAVADVVQARVVLDQAGAASQETTVRSLAAAEVALASALSVSHDAREPLDPRWPQAVSRLAAGRPGVLPARSDPDGAPGRRGRGGPDADQSGLRWALGAAQRIQQEHDIEQDRTGQDGAGQERAGLGGPGVTGRLRRALNPDAAIVTSAARIGIAVAVGAALGRVLGLGHAYWVGLTAAAALQANNVTFVVRRVASRLIGTLAGVVLAWAVFTLHPAVLVVAALATVAQFIAETIIRASYGVAVVFITVLALAIYDLGDPYAQIGAAVGARALDTALGAALVVLLRLVLWRRATAARVPQAQAATLRAAAEVFRIRWLSQPPARPEPAQRRLAEDLLRLQTLTADALADRLPGTAAAHPGQAELAIEELALLALGVPFGRPRPPRPEAEELVSRLDQLAVTPAGGPRPDGLDAPLQLAGYPRTRAATELLASALSHGTRPAPGPGPAGGP